ncbi:hypothetical protein OG539_03665 [Actinacidiphila glaucinigra]|uniref:hypothetical protein n=1 Tax=Actinacidiphila glaucinigra TaxID=235986 RepID=UPI002DD92DEA|nr:hypothetical protein [Actinacidiphila glaucinigra]WSD64494.1 hypothetical protein OIE69_39200 [Actinacidiphila glaucinigra]
MKIMGGLAAGAVFGVFTSLANALSSPYTALGAPITGTPWGATAKVLSLLLDAGWSWAALAVVAGLLAGTPPLGALAGPLALIAATATYYAADHLVVNAGSDGLIWAVFAVFFGPLLGMTGAAVRRPGPTGLLAALTVPVGAAVQMAVLPPRPHLTITPAIAVAEAVVWTASAAGAAWALHRFLAERRAVRAR